jgi:hypothetical protein
MLMPTPRRPTECTGPIAGVRLRPTARAAVFALACAAGLPAAGQASARDDATRVVAGWTLAPSKDGKGCFLTRDFDRNGGTTLLLGLDTDGTNRLSLLNANWSIKPKDQLTLNFRLSNSSYPAHFAVGIASEDKQGFVTSFGAKFPSYFAASKTLAVSRGAVPVVRLSLDGIEAAVAKLQRCVDDQRGQPTAATAGKSRSDDIPSDPFAPAPARKTKK